jgi:hypothetical protein
VARGQLRHQPAASICRGPKNPTTRGRAAPDHCEEQPLRALGCAQHDPWALHKALRSTALCVQDTISSRNRCNEATFIESCMSAVNRLRSSLTCVLRKDLHQDIHQMSWTNKLGRLYCLQCIKRQSAETSRLICLSDPIPMVEGSHTHPCPHRHVFCEYNALSCVASGDVVSDTCTRHIYCWTLGCSHPRYAWHFPTTCRACVKVAMNTCPPSNHWEIGGFCYHSLEQI